MLFGTACEADCQIGLQESPPQIMMSILLFVTHKSCSSNTTQTAAYVPVAECRREQLQEQGLVYTSKDLEGLKGILQDIEPRK